MEIAKSEKNYSSPEFQKGVDHKYRLSVDYPLGMAMVTWHVLMLAPLLLAFWFFRGMEISWWQNLRSFCLIASFGSVALITILYWQSQVKLVWMTEEGDLFYKIRQQERLLRFSDYKYVRMVSYNPDYPLKLIFSNQENDRIRLLFAGTLNFLPQRSLVMSVARLVRLEDRQPVSTKKFTDEIGKSLLKEGFEIKPLESNKPEGEGWLAVRPE